MNEDDTFKCENCGGYYPPEEENSTDIGPLCDVCHYKIYVDE